MALHTLLSLPEAQNLGALYGLSVACLQGLKAGSVNSNYRFWTAAGASYFLRIYEEQDADGAAEEGCLLAWLVDRGVPATRSLLRADGQGTLASYGGKPVAVFRWVEGTMRCQASVCPEDTYAMGRVLAEVHLAGAPRMRAGRFRVADLLTRCEQIGQDASDDLRGMGSQLADALAQAEAQRLPGLPKGLCHGDLFRDNVLWQGPKLAALLDFESAAEGPFAFDVAVTLLAWCFSDDFVPALLASLVAGYTSRRPLTADERLGLFAEARVAALRFTITRVTDYAMRAHLGVTEVRDWRRFFKRYERLGDLGPAGFAALFETGCFPSGTSQGASSP